MRTPQYLPANGAQVRCAAFPYRHPKLYREHPTEDWFNHVFPALMMLRSFARHAATTGRNIVALDMG